MTQTPGTGSHFLESAKVIERSAAALGAKSDAAGRALVDALRSGKKVLAFGNGGSATQASHLVEELIGRFLKTRRPFPAVSLVSDAGVVSCIANDFGYDALFERQVTALADEGDVVVGITTSGASANVLRGLAAAKQKGATTIALTGERGLSEGSADHLLSVPSSVGAHIQEVHLLLIHVMCIAVDSELGT